MTQKYKKKTKFKSFYQKYTIFVLFKSMCVGPGRRNSDFIPPELQSKKIFLKDM